MDRGAWQATVHGVTKSQTRLKQFSTHTHILVQILNTPILDGGISLLTYVPSPRR